jgi:hypothetical protein
VCPWTVCSKYDNHYRLHSLHNKGNHVRLFHQHEKFHFDNEWQMFMRSRNYAESDYGFNLDLLTILYCSCVSYHRRNEGEKINLWRPIYLRSHESMAIFASPYDRAWVIFVTSSDFLNVKLSKRDCARLSVCKWASIALPEGMEQNGPKLVTNQNPTTYGVRSPLSLFKWSLVTNDYYCKVSLL